MESSDVLRAYQANIDEDMVERIGGDSRNGDVKRAAGLTIPHARVA
jgi:hypothetical protein